MSSLKRLLLAVMGAILLLPGGCSLMFTPMLLISAFGRDPIGLGAAGEFFSVALYCVSVGFAIALGGVWLIKCALSRNTVAPVPRWGLTAAGVLLLMPGVSITLDWSWGYLARALHPANPQWGLNASFVALAPVCVGVGVFLLWRAHRRPGTSTAS